MKLNVTTYGAMRVVALIMSLTCCICVAEAAPKSTKSGLQLSVSLSKHTVYVGERLTYEVILWTPDNKIAGVEMVSAPDFGELAIKPIEPDRQLTPDVRKGGWKGVVDRYFVGFDSPGRALLGGGTYNVGKVTVQKIHTLFDGDQLVEKLTAEELVAPQLAVKVKPLPAKGKTEKFSGAVGKFEVNSFMPTTTLVAGEKSSIVFSIAGDGNLDKAKLPELKDAFPEAIRFQSVTSAQTPYVKDGVLGSELELECSFIPEKEGEYKIGPIEFNYFNPETGKYETTVSQPVIIAVTSGKDEPADPPVMLDV